MNNYILFIDSGVGGISTLAETMKICFNNYIFFADNLYSPYGGKSEKFLKNRLKIIIENLCKKYNISLVVLACNTATTTSINFLRKEFKDIVFIGTEPAIKLAVDEEYIHPSLLATPQTIKHFKHRSISNLNKIPHKELASLIEHFLLNKNYINTFNLLKTIYSIKLQTHSNDCIVLGCTHYCLIEDLIFKITHKPCLNGNYGVARRVTSLIANSSKHPYVKIILSSKNSQLLQKYKKILKQILAN